jgi:indolepyruvate ferredoxin oxidoreductase, alpha subunit
LRIHEAADKAMAERSFGREVQMLRAGAGTELHMEGILAVTKALLQAGVAYVGGYQGAPISHLMDVLNDAQEILDELGVHFESSASEATAAAMLAASVNYPLRGAVTWKSTAGTNVASDALANLASGGVTGGALIIIGEDFGEGSSIMQERTHAFAMKSQIWLLDPRPNLTLITAMVEKGFELSEASRTPVMLELRIRACHVHGRFTARDNRRPRMTVRDAMENPVRDLDRIVLPPSNFLHEREKIEIRWPAAVEFVRRERLNEVFPGAEVQIGIAVQGGLYNNVVRGLRLLGLSDDFGNARIPVYCLNVTYPLIDAELIEFCRGKRAVLVVEEGQPDFIEQSFSTTLRRADMQTRLHGKDCLPIHGEYTATAIRDGIEKFLRAAAPHLLSGSDVQVFDPGRAQTPDRIPLRELAGTVPPRPAGFCTGCPERPIFSAMTLLQRETGPMHVSCDIGCHLFSILPPFHIGNTTMGYGLGGAGGAAFNVDSDRPVVNVIGDGGFWHNGLTSSIGNAVFNRNDNIFLIIDNNYSAATGGQDLPSSRANLANRTTGNSIERAVQGVGVQWVRTVDTYDVATMRETLREASQSHGGGPKVIVARNECMLNRQRRERRESDRRLAEGARVVRQRYHVDAETCTGDHACIRLSGCPSLTLRPNPNVLREDPVAYVDNSCVGCGLCGANAHAAVLCPSFSRVDVVVHPRRGERLLHDIRFALIGALQRWSGRRRARRLAAAGV